HCFISNIELKQSLSIDSVEAKYAIRSFNRVDVNEVVISGLNIHAVLDENNQFRLKDFEFPQNPGNQNKENSFDRFLALLPNKIIFKNTRLVLNAFDDEIMIPFDIISSVHKTEHKAVADALFFPFGEKIETMISLDTAHGIESVKIKADKFQTDHLAAILTKVAPGIKITGPADFNIEKYKDENWKIYLSNALLTAPIKAGVKALNTSLSVGNENINAFGSLDLFYPGLPQVNLIYNMDVNLNNNLWFDLIVQNTLVNEYKISHDLCKAVIENPAVKMEVSGTKEKFSGDLYFAFKNGVLNQKDLALNLSGLSVTADYNGDFTASGKGVSLNLTSELEKVNLTSATMASQFKKTKIKGRIHLDKKLNPAFKANIKLAKGKVSLPKHKINVSGIYANLPVTYPVKKKPSAKGTFSIQKLVYDQKVKFKTKGQIAQTGNHSATLRGSVVLDDFPDLKIAYQSKAGLDKNKGPVIHFDFDSKPYTIQSHQLTGFLPKFKQELKFDLNFNSKGSVRYENNSLDTAMVLKVTDGSFKIPDANFAVHGIETTLFMNDLIIPESLPGQILTLDTISINNVLMEDAKLSYSIEDGRSLLVENAQVKWCNGRVSAESIRFPGKDNTYSLTLFCDRLELSRLLRQMGAFTAQGQGTLNGRIPITYMDGEISFDNGFLFSTPGSGGKIIVENTDRLTAGIPMDSPQFAQLDLAKEALKDFEYKWAKLAFNTVDDTLFLKMRMDGKPAKLLPFEYKKEIGSFVRVDASSPGSRFQGIKLDINLKLPFNQVLKFGNQMKNILN
ncbi:MAG: hypothetical protein GY729_20095, partial [Desulfobacteraceae bacterium]|nr:hypothetical protein [Desulfobacteraceae bacterium]